jgi:hypothetical protein
MPSTTGCRQGRASRLWASFPSAASPRSVSVAGGRLLRSAVRRKSERCCGCSVADAPGYSGHRSPSRCGPYCQGERTLDGSTGTALTGCVRLQCQGWRVGGRAVIGVGSSLTDRLRLILDTRVLCLGLLAGAEARLFLTSPLLVRAAVLTRSSPMKKRSSGPSTWISQRAPRCKEVPRPARYQGQGLSECADPSSTAWCARVPKTRG